MTAAWAAMVASRSGSGSGDGIVASGLRTDQPACRAVPDSYTSRHHPVKPTPEQLRKMNPSMNPVELTLHLTKPFISKLTLLW
jgi:hypothetical protein